MSDNEISKEDEEEDSYHTMGDESRSSNEDSSEYTDTEKTSESIVVQETHKYQIKFETKTLGMDVAKGRNKLWVTKVNKEKLKKKIHINDTIIRVNSERVGNDLSALQSPN